MRSDTVVHTKEESKRGSLSLQQVIDTETFEDELLRTAKRTQRRIDDLEAVAKSKYLQVRKREWIDKLILTNKAVYSTILAIAGRKYDERR